MRVTSMLSGELAKRFKSYKLDTGIASDSAAIRQLLSIAFEGCEKADTAKLLHDVKSTTSWGARFSAAVSILSMMNAGPQRADYKHLDLSQRFELCMAAAKHLLAQRGEMDIDKAIAAGRRDTRRSKDRAGAEELLVFMASLNSQAVFNAIDPADLKDWITSMFAYRRGEGGESDFDYVVGRQHLLSILYSMGIKTAQGAKKKFDGSWVFSHNGGWMFLSSEAQDAFIPIAPSDYTDAFDPLDPHPENYSASGMVSAGDAKAHERWAHECAG